MRALISAKYDYIFGLRKLMNLIVIENNGIDTENEDTFFLLITILLYL